MIQNAEANYQARGSEPTKAQSKPGWKEGNESRDGCQNQYECFTNFMARTYFDLIVSNPVRGSWKSMIIPAASSTCFQLLALISILIKYRFVHLPTEHQRSETAEFRSLECVAVGRARWRSFTGRLDDRDRKPICCLCGTKWQDYWIFFRDFIGSYEWNY